ncbi:MAG: response regulator transcription factor [Chloroflexi bacterium]|nr:response regulator transcription factor [Chloroflexota bacterium]
MNPEPVAKPISILIVDDHPMVREGMRSMLQAPEIKVVGEAASGAEALRLVAKLKPDVVLMDIRMPDMDGIAALQAIKEARFHSQVIMVTTYQNTTYLLRSLAAGASGFILKDISRQKLLETVHAVAAGVSRVDRQFLQRVLQDLAQPELGVTQRESDLVEPLTPREMDVLRLLVEGMTNQAIAHALGLKAGTVKGYVQTILEKLNATDRTQAAVKAVRMGLVQ